MALPDFTMRELFEAGVHFGHQKHRWNPKMEPFLFGVRNNIHIIDLSRTVPLLHQALTAVREVSERGGRILFVGTKRAASGPVAKAAGDCSQYYIDHRWLGGMLTNWKTITKSIKRLRELEDMLDGGGDSGLTKKEQLNLSRERDKLERAIGGIKEMGGLPDLVFVIDTNKESIAIREACKLNIPIVAILDSNSNPDGVTWPVPGNDDAARAITLYCDLISRAILDGMSRAVEVSAEEMAGPDPAAADQPTADGNSPDQGAPEQGDAALPPPDTPPASPPPDAPVEEKEAASP